MSDEAAETVGAGIRRLRIQRGLTQRDLAQPEYSRALLAAVEAGIRSPTEDLLRHVAGRLGVELDDVRFGRPPGIADELAGQLGDARRALARGELDVAAEVFDEVKGLAQRYGLVDVTCWAGYQAGEARLQQGDMAGAAAAFDALAELLPDAGPAPRAAVVARRAYCQFVAGDAAGAVGVLEEALAAARRAPAALRSVDAQLRLSSALMYSYLELEWRDRARQVETQARPLLSDVTNREWLAQFLIIAGQLRRGEDELPEAERMFTEAGRLYQELGLTREVGLSWWAHGYVLRRVGRLDGAAQAFDAARRVLDQVGALQDHAGATLELAEVRRQQGDLVEAARLARAAAKRCEQSQHLECMAEADRLLGLVAAERSRNEQARSEPDRNERTGSERTGSERRDGNGKGSERGRGAGASGERSVVGRAHAESVDGASDSGESADGTRAEGDRAGSEQVEGDDAEMLLGRAVKRYTQVGLMAEVVTTCRVLGELQLAAGRTEAAAASFRRGLEAARALR